MLGAVTSRGDAQTLRLAMLYALADRSARVTDVHIDAAYALWRYCRASAAWIWTAGAAGDPTAQRILAELAKRPQGMNRRALHALFHRHLEADRLDAVLGALASEGRVRSQMVATGGRKAEVWTLSERTNKAN